MVNQKHTAPDSKYILMASLFLLVAAWSMFPQSFIDSDPWGYSFHAFDIATQQFDWGASPSVFKYRLGLLLPTAAVYSIFGVSIYTTNALPLISALLIVITVYFASPTAETKIWSTLLAASSPLLFKNMVVLYPDIVMTGYLSISLLFLYFRHRALDSWNKGVAISFLSVLFLFLAFLTKLSAYWALPMWILCVVSDFKAGEKRMLRNFYGPAILAGLLLGFFYLVFCGLIYGDPLARVRAIQSLTGVHLWAWNGASQTGYLMRLTLGPVLLYIAAYKFILPLALHGAFIATDRSRFWVHYAGLTFALYSFGSTSLTSYEPMPLWERMILPSLPGLCVAASISLAHLRRQISGSMRFANIRAMIILSALVFLPFFIAAPSLATDTSKEKVFGKMIEEVQANVGRTYILISSDRRSPQSLEFFLGYRVPANLRMIWVGDVRESDITSTDEIFMYIDRNLSAFLETSYGHRNFDAKIFESNIVPVHQSGGVFLFKVEARHLRELLSRIDFACCERDQGIGPRARGRS